MRRPQHLILSWRFWVCKRGHSLSMVAGVRRRIPGKGEVSGYGRRFEWDLGARQCRTLALSTVGRQTQPVRRRAPKIASAEPGAVAGDAGGDHCRGQAPARGIPAIGNRSAISIAVACPAGHRLPADDLLHGRLGRCSSGLIHLGRMKCMEPDPDTAHLDRIAVDHAGNAPDLLSKRAARRKRDEKSPSMMPPAAS